MINRETLPSHWDYLPIRSIFYESDMRNGNDNYELLSVTQNQGIIKQSVDSKKDTSNDDKSKYKVVLKNSIAYNKMRMWQGAVGINELEDGIVSPAYVVINPINKNINTKYYYYLFKSTYMISQFGKYSYGLVDDMNSLRYEHFRNIYVPIPPLGEDDKIVQKIDKKVQDINNFIKKKKNFIEFLKEQKEAIINKAVTKGINDNVGYKDSNINWLGDIPSQWEIEKLKYLTVNKTNKSNQSDFKVGLENIESNTSNFLPTEESAFSEDGIIFDKNDILFGKLRPYLAKVYLAEQSGICVSEFLVLKSKNILDKYLKYILLSTSFIDNVNSSTYGTKMPRANWDFIGNTKIPKPKLAEQKKIVIYIEKELSKINSIIEKTEKEIELINEYRTSLINKAVFGK